LTANKLKKEDINLLVPHQGQPEDQSIYTGEMALREDQVYNNIMRYGNTTAASIPMP